MSKYILTDEEKAKIWDCEWLTDRERRVFDLYYRRGWRIEDIVAELADEERAGGDKRRTYSRSTVERDLRRLRNYG